MNFNACTDACRDACAAQWQDALDAIGVEHRSAVMDARGSMRQLLISFVDNEAAIFRTDAGREKTPVTASLLAYAMADALVRVSDQMKMSTDQFPTVQDLALSRFELAHIEEDNRSARRWKRIVSRLFPWFFSAETVAVSLIHPQR